MRRRINLLVIVLVFLLGAAAGYAVGYGVWAVKPSQVARFQTRAQHLTEKVFGLAPGGAAHAGGRG